MTRTKNALHIGAALLLTGSLLLQPLTTLADDFDWSSWDSVGGLEEETAYVQDQEYFSADNQPHIPPRDPLPTRKPVLTREPLPSGEYTVIGHVSYGLSDIPVRRAIVSLSDRESLTDGNGGYVLRSIPTGVFVVSVKNTDDTSPMIQSATKPITIPNDCDVNKFCVLDIKVSTLSTFTRISDNDVWGLLSATDETFPSPQATATEEDELSDIIIEPQEQWGESWEPTDSENTTFLMEEEIVSETPANEYWDDQEEQPLLQSNSDVRGGGWTTEDAASFSTETGFLIPPRPPLPPRSSLPTRTPQERGTWFWDRALPLRQSTIDGILATSAQYNLNAIYYTIEDYPAYLAQNNQTKIAQMRDALRLLSTQARAKGIRVDAVVGERNWGEEADYGKALASADFIIDYNRTAAVDARVGALQFDVEPHTMATYEDNKDPILRRFVGMLDAVATRIGGSGVDLKFDVVAPHFFDSVQNWTPPILYNGKTQHTYNHVLDILQKVPGGKYIIMDYRNFTAGPTGSIALARPEIEQASARNANTTVIIALETGNFDPVDIISYYGMCRSKLHNDMDILNATFQSQSSFGGFSIDAFDTYRDQLRHPEC